MSEIQRRKDVRLKGYDYAQAGAYFVTICTADKKCLLSRVSTGSAPTWQPQIIMSDYGKIAEKYIRSMAGIERYVIMPNHIHFILIKGNDCKRTLAQDVRSFKTLVTKEIGRSIWQRLYYEHVVRDEKDYLIKAKYIEDNPAKWTDDEMYVINEIHP